MRSCELMAYVVHWQTEDTICICLDCESRTVHISHHARAKPIQDSSASLKGERQRLLFQQLVEMGFDPDLAAKAVAAGCHLLLSTNTKHTFVAFVVLVVFARRCV
jgi:hypothetical protein